MTVKRTLKLIHLTGTFFFLASIAFILILALRQREVSWWVIFSLTGHTIFIALFLLSVYLFAMFRGISGSPEVGEHPLTSSGYYMLLYVCSPYLGLATGIMAMVGEDSIARFLLGISLGTFGATFIAWVVIDPLAGLVESILPSCRQARSQRLDLVRVEKANADFARKLVLEQVLKAEDVCRNEWKDELSIYAEKLATLVAGDSRGTEIEMVAASIGVKAWQMGGLTCMKFLHEMAMEAYQARNSNVEGQYDTISVWWDGIGRWQNSSIV